MKLNEYGIFEYSKNGHSLEALVSNSLATFFSPFLQPVMKWPVILGSQLDWS